MELDKEKIMQLKSDSNLTWDDIAQKGGLKSRQHAFDKFKDASIKNVGFFAVVFGVKEKEIIKWD